MDDSEYLPQVKAWLRKAAELFSKHFETAHMLRIIIYDPQEGHKHNDLVLKLSAMVRTISTTGEQSHLTRLESAILRHVTTTPIPAKQLASRMGRRLNSHFRDALRSLCRTDPPLLIRTPDGYRAQ
jgi:hypothetical protein